MPFKIVYLDDERELCDIFVDLFESPEVAISTFVDPKLAIAAIRENPPDMIFLDYRLPSASGDEVAVELNNAIPKVLVTGDLLGETKYPFLKVLQKPIDPEQVKQLIDREREVLRLDR